MSFPFFRLAACASFAVLGLGCGHVGLEELSEEEAMGDEPPLAPDLDPDEELEIDQGNTPTICSEGCPEPNRFLVRHNFELGVPNDGLMTPGGFISRSETIVQSGGYSMFTSQDEPGAEAERWDAFEPQTSGRLYARAWFFLPEGSVSDWIKLLAHNGSPGGSHDINIHKDGSLEIFSDLTRQRVFSTPAAVPEGKWFCVQVETLLSNDAGHVHVWVDGKHRVSMTELDTVPNTGLSRVAYGIAASGDDQWGGQVFVDNYALASEPVGCDYDVPLETELGD